MENGFSYCNKYKFNKISKCIEDFGGVPIVAVSTCHKMYFPILFTILLPSMLQKPMSLVDRMQCIIDFMHLRECAMENVDKLKKIPIFNDYVGQKLCY